jgi:dihydrofolate reductase
LGDALSGTAVGWILQHAMHLCAEVVCYSVAMSLDGFIAGPKGEYDWIIHDPAVDFGAMLRQFDTLLMGRRTFDLARSQSSLLKSMNMKIVVVSSTLNPTEHKDVTIVSSGVPQPSPRSKQRQAKQFGSLAEAYSFAAWSMQAW